MVFRVHKYITKLTEQKSCVVCVSGVKNCFFFQKRSLQHFPSFIIFRRIINSSFIQTSLECFKMYFQVKNLKHSMHFFVDM